jgi:hypothetical protein
LGSTVIAAKSRAPRSYIQACSWRPRKADWPWATAQASSSARLRPSSGVCGESDAGGTPARAGAGGDTARAGAGGVAGVAGAGGVAVGWLGEPERSLIRELERSRSLAREGPAARR